MTDLSRHTNNSSSPNSVSCQNELLILIGSLVDVMFCIKSADGRYLEVNDAFVRRSGKTSMREVIGATAKDLFKPELAQRYEKQDQTIFDSGHPLKDELELVRRPNDKLGWYMTTKLPIRGENTSDIVAIASISRDLRTPTSERVAMESLQDVVHYVQTHLQDTIRNDDLARIAGCSIAQLDKRVKHLFGLSPTQYVLRVRVDHGVGLLRETDLPITDIALLCGFYDQPHFTRKLARLTSYTPAQFRALNATA